MNALPVGPCTPNRKTLVNLNTPPPNASIINKLKVKGSLTDPPAPRRRQNAQPVRGLPLPFMKQRLMNHLQVTSELFDIDEDEYAPYPTFSASNQYGFPIPVNDPFNAPALSTITETAYNNYYKPEKSGCSICGLQASTLAILEPCSHPLCSTCLTR